MRCTYNITVTFMPAVDSLVACFCGQSDGLLTFAKHTPDLDKAGGGHFSPVRLLPGLAAQRAPTQSGGWDFLAQFLALG